MAGWQCERTPNKLQQGDGWPPLHVLYSPAHSRLEKACFHLAAWLGIALFGPLVARQEDYNIKRSAWMWITDAAASRTNSISRPAFLRMEISERP